MLAVLCSYKRMKNQGLVGVGQHFTLYREERCGASCRFVWQLDVLAEGAAQPKKRVSLMFDRYCRSNVTYVKYRSVAGGLGLRHRGQRYLH